MEIGLRIRASSQVLLGHHFPSLAGRAAVVEMQYYGVREEQISGHHVLMLPPRQVTFIGRSDAHREDCPVV